MRPAVITFTTDFGTRDPYVGVMKGQVLRRCPAAQLVDLSHDIRRHDPAEAGFWLARASRYFPEGTVHVAVVDPGVGTGRALIALSSEGQLFLAPDNGLLGEVAARPGAGARRLDLKRLAGLGITATGPTFHGRDLLAPVAAELASGRLGFDALGEACEPLRLAAWPAPVAQPWGWQGRVVTVDGFGNVFSNLDLTLLEESRNWTVRAGGRELRRVGTYGEAEPGELVALVNAWGIVEVAEVQGDAAARLGLRRGDPLELHYRQGH